MTFCFLALWAEGCATLLQAIAQVITTRSVACLRKMLVAINVKANAKNTFYNNRNVTSWSFLSSLQPNECLVLWYVELIFSLYRFARMMFTFLLFISPPLAYEDSIIQNTHFHILIDASIARFAAATCLKIIHFLSIPSSISSHQSTLNLQDLQLARELMATTKYMQLWKYVSINNSQSEFVFRYRGKLKDRSYWGWWAYHVKGWLRIEMQPIVKALLRKAHWKLDRKFIGEFNFDSFLQACFVSKMLCF